MCAEAGLFIPLTALANTGRLVLTYIQAISSATGEMFGSGHMVAAERGGYLFTHSYSALGARALWMCGIM